MRKLYPSRRMLSGLLLVALSCALVLVESSQQCSEKFPDCADGHYCDFHVYVCKSCDDLCKRNIHDCNDKCRDYTLAALRQQVSSMGSAIATRMTVIWVMSAVIVLLVVGLVFLVLKHKLKTVKCPKLPWQKKKDTPTTVVMTHENPNTKSPKTAPKNGANLTRQNTQQTTVSSPEQDVENSVQTDTTTISHRYPAEDSTEGLSYVNHACSVTPTSNISAPRY